MSKQTSTEETETKVWINVDYTNTWAYKTIQAFKNKATEAGLVLEPDKFTNDATGQLQRLRYNPETGAPIRQENVLSGHKNVFFYELPKEKAARKKFIDNIIESTNSIKENIQYYYQELDQHNFAVKSDATFSYEDFVNCSIEELQQLSARGGGSKSSGYYRDRECSQG
jgi:hypothetical protein